MVGGTEGEVEGSGTGVGSIVLWAFWFLVAEGGREREREREINFDNNRHSFFCMFPIYLLLRTPHTSDLAIICTGINQKSMQEGEKESLYSIKLCKVGRYIMTHTHTLSLSHQKPQYNAIVFHVVSYLIQTPQHQIASPCHSSLQTHCMPLDTFLPFFHSFIHPSCSILLS